MPNSTSNEASQSAVNVSRAQLEELHQALLTTSIDAQLQKFSQPDRHTLRLTLYRHASWHLLACLKPGASAVRLSNERQAAMAKPPNFTLFVKKHLVGKSLSHIVLPADVLRLLLDFGELQLVLDFNPKIPNAYLCNRQLTIVRALFAHSQWEGKALPPGAAERQSSAARELSQAELESLRRRQLRQRLERRLVHLQEDIAEAEQANQHLQWAEVLKQHLAAPGIDRQKRLITMLHVATETGEWQIPVPKPLSLLELMQYYFQQYRKLRRRGEVAHERLQATQTELAKVENLELPLTSRTLPKAQSKPEQESSEDPKWRGVAKHLSPDDFVVLRGKNAEGNDRLLKLAQGNDLWLHATHMPGSHCLIVQKGKLPIPHSTVEWAAALALKHSKAAGSGAGEVTLARRQDVKKIKGAKPGQVRLLRARTLHVRIKP